MDNLLNVNEHNNMSESYLKSKNLKLLKNLKFLQMINLLLIH